MSRHWTPEEDELIYRYGSQMPLPQLAELLTKKTGYSRSELSICARRRRIDPAWNVDPVGYISFHTVTGHGARNTAVNLAAMRQAIADGVIKRRYVGGYKRVFVPVKWADEWIQKREEQREEYDRLRAAGWMTTGEVARKLGISRRTTALALRHKVNLNGTYQVFRGVEKVLAPDLSYLWEPVAMNVAITAFKRVRQSIACPPGWWGLNRTARELEIGHKSLRPLAQWLIDLGFDRLRIRMNAAGHFYWTPADVIAFREANAERLKAGWDRKRKRKSRT